MPIAAVVGDANVLLSAIIGKAALQVFTDYALQVHATEFNVLEVERYLPRLSATYELSEHEVRLQLRLLPVDVHPADSYVEHFDWATELLKTRDADDAHPLALAHLLDLPLWSNDRDLQIRGIRCYTTASLLKLLEEQAKG